ncbi:MFS transporter [Sinorhizobium meliloti]|uniref:MFS transporter n=1 Tax=Rhizobium meliloti TaxID=382 RepID=UPI0012982078|nr:MFS transporter [Sinorhizobium meliloti]MQV20200.1 MFS transporter [Sinorhizobium meliloti]
MNEECKGDDGEDGRIHFAFDRDIQTIAISAIVPLKSLPEGARESRKFAQVLSSIKAIGLVEAPVVISFLGLILVFWRWRTGSARIRATKSEPPCEATAMGFSAMLSNSRFRSLLVRTFICFFGASSMWSLLPAFAALQLQMEAAEVGLLMGTIGVGAVLGGTLLPRLKAKIGINRLIAVASTQLGLALLLAAWNGTSVTIWVSMLATGVGWAFIVSSLNGSAQLMFPKSIRASAISAYLMVMYGATTNGSCLWGALSAFSDVSTTFIVAAWMLILSPLLASRWPIE